MPELTKECHCDVCGSEAEMTITCKMIEVENPSGVKMKKQVETRTCKVCGNEADMIIDFDD